MGKTLNIEGLVESLERKDSFDLKAFQQYYSTICKLYTKT